jgi:hypothetical protein
VKSVWSCNVSTACCAVNLNIMMHIVHDLVCIWFVFGKDILMSWLYSSLYTGVSGDYNVSTVDHPLSQVFVNNMKTFLISLFINSVTDLCTQWISLMNFMFYNWHLVYRANVTSFFWFLTTDLKYRI